MRKIFIFCVCVSMLCGCSDKGSRERQRQAVAYSIAKAEQQRLEMQERARADSLSIIAWGDLRFGMSKGEALQTVSLKKGTVNGNTISMDCDTRFALEQAFGLKEFRQFDVTFEENGLSFVTIKSSKVSASRIDDLVNDCKILADNFAKKMGEPVMSNDEKINVFSFNEGKMFDFACFSIGDKYVFIKLGETCSGSEYFYEVNIGNSHNPMKKHEPTPEEKAQRQKEDEERQRIIDNSF